MVLPSSNDPIDVEVDIEAFVTNLGIAVLQDNQVTEPDFIVAFVRFAAVVRPW